MTIDLIVQWIVLLFNKYRRGQVKITNITYAIKLALYEFYNEELAKYTNSSRDVIPNTLTTYVTTQTITLSLPNPNPTGGTKAILPSALYIGGLQTSTIAFARGITFFTDFGYEGTIVQPEEYADRMASLIIPPTNEFPIAKVQGDFYGAMSIYVLPAQITKINLTYFKLPFDFNYSVTYDADGRGFVFNPSSSTDIDINPLFAGEIAKRAAIILGIPYQNPDLDNLKS